MKAVGIRWEHAALKSYDLSRCVNFNCYSNLKRSFFMDLRCFSFPSQIQWKSIARKANQDTGIETHRTPTGDGNPLRLILWFKFFNKIETHRTLTGDGNYGNILNTTLHIIETHRTPTGDGNRLCHIIPFKPLNRNS